MQVIAHKMEYKGGQIAYELRPRHYSDSDHERYKAVYQTCFHDLRETLERYPVDVCVSRKKLEREKGNIYILETAEKLVGSVAVYGNEIDELFVAKDFQRRGCGEALLCFAVSLLQKRRVSPIVLHVADWNKGALYMYLKNGFKIVSTEMIE